MGQIDGQKGHNMSIQEEILKSIDIMVQRAIKKYQITEVASVVEAVNGEKYTVSLDGNRFDVKDGINLKPSVGTPVWIKLPNGTGNLSGAYIMAKR